jgi:SAM-dependent methyltransferase
MSDVPDFSRVAASYTAARPGYPQELFDWLADQVERHELAWDAATGGGQAAMGLTRHFRRVMASDRSREQLAHAQVHPRIHYRAATAEASGLPDRSVDLIVAAAAIHWFDLDRFYAEAMRVVRPGGVLAAWTYHVAHVEPPFDAVLGPFYENVVAPHFGSGARLVDDRYEGLTLPGSALRPPAFVASVRWTEPQILAFIRTWSGVEAYRRATGRDPVHLVEPAIRARCESPGAVHELRWPLYLRASRL